MVGRGLGVGSSSLVLQDIPSVQLLDIVEIDSNVVDLATKYFRFQNMKGKIIHFGIIILSFR